MFSVTRDTKRNAAQRRYLWRINPAMAAYVVVLMVSTWLIRQHAPTGAALFVLSLLPALPLLGAIAAMGLYLTEERDEFIRSRLVSAMLGGLGMLLAITTVWGFLENGGAVAHFPTYLAFPVWCGCFGVWQCFANLRDRRAGRSGGDAA